MNNLLTYDAVQESIWGKRCHLLLGNGFSIACDPVFRYDSLFDAAVDGGISTKAQEIFTRLGTNNFEGVMRLLDDADWIARTYGLVKGEGSPMLDDVEVVKRTLVEAVATSHLGHSGEVSAEKKNAALRFLEPYCYRR